jgi:DNA-binding XRE family transcriptional regulator
LTTYLGYDPFNDPTLGSPKGNEPSCVAFLSPDAPVTLGKKIKQYRLKLRKTRKQVALELGISVKTLWGWETDRWQPTAQCGRLLAGSAFSVTQIALDNRMV